MITEMYSHYIDNLLQFKDYISFHAVSELSAPELFWKAGNNEYLREFDTIKLAANIQKNGMHFPFFINTDLEVIEGFHRYHSLRLANDIGRYMCIDFTRIPDTNNITIQVPGKIINKIARDNFRVADDSKYYAVTHKNNQDLEVFLVEMGIEIGHLTFIIRDEFKGSELIYKEELFHGKL
ncbi:MAG: hypothetical protein PHT13_00210 [Methanosarcina sp.]|nr:hypothetical protein [Methanosarcina sp.]